MADREIARHYFRIGHNRPFLMACYPLSKQKLYLCPIHWNLNPLLFHGGTQRPP
jgi:hypothetical protein